MPAIRHILVDADGVIQSSRSGWLDRVAALAPAAGNTDEFLKRLFAAEAPALVGEISFEHALDNFLTENKCVISVEDALSLWKEIEVCFPVVDLVTGYRSRELMVHLASNQNAFRARYMSGQLRYDRLFDKLFFSCDLGHRKPAAAFFQRILTTLQTRPEQVLLIDDSIANVEAARPLGLSGIVFSLNQDIDLLRMDLERYLNGESSPYC